MYIKRQLQKRLIISVISVMVLVITIMSSSYALFMNVGTDVKDQVITVGDLVVTYNNTSSAITIDDMQPMTDSVALAGNNNLFVVTIQNTGDLAYDYQIKLENNTTEYPTANFLDHQYIRYCYMIGENNCSSAQKLSQASNGVIHSGVLKAKDSMAFKVKIWVGSGDATDPTKGMPNSVIGQEIHLNIVTDGKATAATT